MTQESESFDLRWMRLAVAEAYRGQGRVEPNPMVGAVVVQGGQAVGVGYHGYFGGPHAEVVALAQAGERARNGTLYVTLEPCCHHGKTPPCTDAILAAGISRVVMAQRDPFPKVAGGGLAVLVRSGVTVEEGLEAELVHRLNAPYLKRQLTARPYVIGKWAMTLDGKIATASGHSQWISNERSRALVHELRGRMDVIAVGIETALADDPRLTARPSGPRAAIRLVLDSRARLPLDSVLVRSAQAIPVCVAVTGRAPEQRVAALRGSGCEVLSFDTDDRVPIGSLLDRLGERSATNLLIEGGGRLAGAFLDAGELDEVWTFIGPCLEGGTQGAGPVMGRGVQQMHQAARLRDQEVMTLDTDVLIRGTLKQPWQDLRPVPENRLWYA